jgi:hypothetical protein
LCLAIVGADQQVCSPSRELARNFLDLEPFDHQQVVGLSWMFRNARVPVASTVNSVGSASGPITECVSA